MANEDEFVTRFVQEGETEASAALNRVADAQDKLTKSSSTLTQAQEKLSRAQDDFANKLRNAGGAISDTFAKAEAAGAKLKTLTTAYTEQSLRQDALTKSIKVLSASYGDLAPETQAAKGALAALNDELEQNKGQITNAQSELAKYGDELGTLVSKDERLVEASNQVKRAHVEVATASIQAAGGLARSGDATNKAATGYKDLFAALRSIPGPIGQVAGALGDVASKLEASGGSVSGLLGKLGGFAVVGGIVAGAVSFISSAVNETERYAVAVSKVAAATNSSVEFISGLAEVADDASIALTGTGVSVDEVGNALSRFNVLIGRGVDEQGNFTQANAKTKQALKELGVDLTDSAGKLKELKDVLPDIADAFQRIGPGAQTSSLAKQLGLTELLPLLLQGRDALKDVTQAAIIDEKAAQSVKDYAAAWDALEDSIKKVKIQLSGSFLPDLTRAVDALAFRLGASGTNAGEQQKAIQLLIDYRRQGALTADQIKNLTKAQRDFIQELSKADPQAKSLLKTYDDATAIQESLQRGIDATTARYKAQADAIDQAASATADANNRLAQSIQQSLEGTGFSGSFGVTADESAKFLEQQKASSAQALALAKASQASTDLARAQGLLKGILDATTGSIAAQSSPLDRFGKVQAAIGISTGKISPEQFIAEQAQKSLNEARRQGIITDEQYAATSIALSKQIISSGDALVFSGKAATPFVKTITDVSNLYKATGENIQAFDLANKQGVDLIGQQVANRPVAVGHTVTKTSLPGNDKLNEAGKTVLEGESKLADLQKTAEGSNKLTAQAVANAKAQNKSTTEVTQAQLTQMQVAAQNNLDIAKANQELSKSKQQFNELAGQVGKEQTDFVITGFAKFGDKAVSTLRGSISDATKDFSVDPFQLSVDAVLNKKPLDEFAASVAATPLQQRIDFVSQTLGKTPAQLAEELAKLPSKVDIEYALKATNTSNVSELIDLFRHPEQTDFTILFDVQQKLGAANPQEAIAKLQELQSKDVQFTLKILGLDSTQEAAKLLSEKIVTVDGKTYSVKLDADTTAATTKLTTLDAAKIKDKTFATTTDLVPVTTSLDNLDKYIIANKSFKIDADPTEAKKNIDSIEVLLGILTSKKRTVTVEIINRVVNEAVTRSATCFAAGTMIATPNGEVNITAIKVGDEVRAFDDSTGQIETSRVLRTFTNHSEMMLLMRFSNGASFVCTMAHPIYSMERDEYVDARSFQLAERVRLVDGSQPHLVQVLLLPGCDTFNFEVETHNNYFAAGVLVHNLSEKIDGQLGGLRNSLTNLALAGGPGELGRAQRMVMQVLLPGLASRPNVSTDNSRSVSLSPVFNVGSVGESRAALEVIQALAGGF